jgi:transposase
MIKTIVHHEGAAGPAAAGTHRASRAGIVKLGLDIHSKVYVVAAQHDHAALRPPRRFAPPKLVPWVKTLLALGHTVHVVYEACGFGFGLCRALLAAGAHCHVIAPRKLDEQRTGVKTDARDAATLCQRLSRFIDGNTKELAVIRVPTEEEEKLRHIDVVLRRHPLGWLAASLSRFRSVHRQRESLVRARTKIQAQGRGLLVSHSMPAPPHWWRAQTWSRLGRLLPGWLIERLEVLRPVLATLDTQIAALSLELEAAAPEDLPRGLGKLTSVVLTREVCDWKRFKNRRQVASYTGLCPGEHSSGNKRVQGSVTKLWRRASCWRPRLACERVPRSKAWWVGGWLVDRL